MATLPEKRHTLAHLLAAAVLERYPHAKATIGPAVDNGFYYDFDFSGGDKPSEADLEKLTADMRGILESWEEMSGTEVSEKDARDRFKGNDYKLELIGEITDKGEPITLYAAGGFTDLCRGGHSEYPAKDIPADSFELDRIAGAYWRGDEEKPMLTRIYGLAFDTKAELDAYKAQVEEAKKRDHRKIGEEQDLFTFSPLVGGGLPLFTPKGTVLREEIHRFSQELRAEKGYERVAIPHITKTDLYETSGHWAKFGDELFLVKSQETSDKFVLKPMNCPHHTQIYASRGRSYRDLPIRYMETTAVYRDEKKGELAGLSRVRSITQDDSHVFCRPDQIEEEYRAIMDVVMEFYRVMDMKFRARLSFRSSETPEKYLGDAELWDKAQAQLENIAKNGGFEYFIAEGEAAFYGPKIDFMATDALGREHQLATGQLDFVQPARFELEYTAEDGSKKTPVMIHLAIAGSLERFLSVYIEHTAGVFPLWMAPVQAAVLPVSEKHADYAASVMKELKAAGIRAELIADDSLGKRIRETKVRKLPSFIVVGDAEKDAGTVTVENNRNGDKATVPLTEFIEATKARIKERTNI
jgi:threonyl-tRNA synthetase